MFKEKIESYRWDIVHDLMKIINIKTVNDLKKPNKPFGEGVYDGLKFILEKGNELNLKSQNYCGYCGQIEAGEGSYTVGVLCNVDVLDVDEKWTKDPFKALLEEGRIFGRGALKGKGPLIACLYAIKILKDQGYIPKDKKVKLIVSADKESGYKGINYYKEYEEPPEIGFATDGKFPVIYGEKGTINMDINMEVPSNFDAPINIVHISGGEDIKKVPSKLNIILSCDDIFKLQIEDELEKFAKENKLKYKTFSQNKLMSIEIKGKTAHSYEPKKGINAISYGIKFLSKFEDMMDRRQFLTEYEKLISTCYNGEKLNCEFEDEDTGKLTFNVGTIKLTGDMITLGVDVRFPSFVVYNEVIEQIKTAFKYSPLKVENIEHIRPVAFSKDSFVVKKLMKGYMEVTGDDNSRPYVTQGTSYARSISNTVAFGPENEENLFKDGIDENISVEYLMQLTEIYAIAIYELLK